MQQKHWVMDYETLSNCFLGVFEDYKTDEVHVFTMGLLRNDILDLIEFFENNIANKERHISFNGLGFDSQITEFILKHKRALTKMSGVDIGILIYKEAQETIRRSNAREFAKYSERKLSIKQIDVFKLNHWDNPAKRSSLKWIQCSMDWHNVQDMPIPHTTKITTVEQLKEIASYCRNDVSSTKKIMELSSKQINLRGVLSKTYKVNLYSASEPRISKELFLHFLSKTTGQPKYELKKLRTFRKAIYVRDLILDYTDFKGVPVFVDLLRNFRNLVIDPNQTKGGFKYSVKHRGVKIDYGLGGIHGIKSGIYESDEFMTIMSSDVVSYYPNLAIRNKWSPAQINNGVFVQQYEWFFDERKKIPKSNPQNYVYKIILNSTYGLSNDKNSFLYDPEFTMRITINGQLSLTMLYIMIVENIPGAIPIMLNTDGLEVKIPKKYKDKYLEICEEWETITKLKLEHDEYEKLVVPDVNNYIGVFKPKEVSKDDFYKLQKEAPYNKFHKQNGKYSMSKVKCKGRFEFNDRPLHKNKSFAVVPKAIFNFFVHDIPVEEYIKTNNNIFDYCGQVKVKGLWKFEYQYVAPSLPDKYVNYTLEQKRDYVRSHGWQESWDDDNWVRSDDPGEANTGSSTKAVFFSLVKEYTIQNDPLQKNLRYMVTNKGGKILKKNTEDGRIINVVAGKWVQTLFNKYEDKPFIDYDLNKAFYLTKIRKEITQMDPEIFSTQTKIQF